MIGAVPEVTVAQATVYRAPGGLDVAVVTVDEGSAQLQLRDTGLDGRPRQDLVRLAVGQTVDRRGNAVTLVATERPPGRRSAARLTIGPSRTDVTPT